MTDQERKAMQMALEALDSCEFDYDWEERPYKTFDEDLVNDAVDALRKALAQQALADSIRPKGKSITKVWVDEINQALAQPANQSDCGHKEYRPFCQMCMATKQKPEQEPYADKANQLNSDRMQIDPVTGDVSIGTPSKPEQHHEPSWQAGFAEGKQATMNQFIRDDCDKRSRPYQEPYCWVQSKLSQGMFYKEKPRRIHTIPLYTAPPSKPWVSLTDEEIDYIYKQNHNQYGEDITGEYERELEAKLKEKNT